MSKKTSAEVAHELGITHNRLLLFLTRHPAFRPAERVGKRRMYLWSELEIDAVRTYYAAHPRPHSRLPEFISAKRKDTDE
jgi:hypothetical protein